MSELGDRLRAARESQGISLAQAAAETRILQRYLVALEEGDYKYLPGDVYARGFIRNYALYLKIPVEELIQLYRYERGRTEPIVIQPAVIAPQIRGTMLPNVFGVLFVVLTIAGLGYLVLRAIDYLDLAPSPVVSTVATDATPTIEVQVPTPLPLEATAEVAATPAPEVVVVTATPAITSTPEAPIVLTVQVDAGQNPGSWLHVKVDNKSVFQKILKPGESLRYTAQRDIWIRAGNAYVVTVNVNGVEQRLSDKPGDVVSFSWPPP